MSESGLVLCERVHDTRTHTHTPHTRTHSTAKRVSDRGGWVGGRAGGWVGACFAKLKHPCRSRGFYLLAPLPPLQAAFASTVAPFGGFLASAIKRAYKVKKQRCFEQQPIFDASSFVRARRQHGGYFSATCML